VGILLTHIQVKTGKRQLQLRIILISVLNIQVKTGKRQLVRIIMISVLNIQVNTGKRQLKVRIILTSVLNVDEVHAPRCSDAPVQGKKKGSKDR
jgi:hypothetical protein